MLWWPISPRTAAGVQAALRSARSRPRRRSAVRHPAGDGGVDEPGPDLPRRMTGEACGTAMLLIAVVGSGIMGERLAGGSVALALLANALATGAALLALILALAPVS